MLFLEDSSRTTELGRMVDHDKHPEPGWPARTGLARLGHDLPEVISTSIVFLPLAAAANGGIH